MFFLSQMIRWIGTPDEGVLFDWSDCLQRHRIALSSILLLAMFLCGAAAFVLPLASELAAYRADENAYAAIAEMSIHAPSPSPMPIIPLPAPTGSTENDAEPRRCREQSRILRRAWQPMLGHHPPHHPIHRIPNRLLLPPRMLRLLSIQALIWRRVWPKTRTSLPGFRFPAP